MMHMLSGYKVVYTAKYVFGQGQVSAHKVVWKDVPLKSIIDMEAMDLVVFGAWVFL
jgi:hypothetical protein